MRFFVSGFLILARFLLGFGVDFMIIDSEWDEGQW